MTPAETRYAQIEKELLALVFGLERNHQYTYGHKIKLWTDHKPLITIVNKPLVTAPKRLQRLLIRLFQYDVEVCYKPGKEMYLADTLSRAYIECNEQSVTEKETESINMMDYLPVSQSTQSEVERASSEDTELQAVKYYIQKGWPEHKHELKKPAHAYFNVKDELTIQGNLVFKGQQLVIPKTMRNSIKAKLHSPHSGINSTLRSARDTVYWPRMSKDIRDFVEHCETCNKFHNEQPKETIIQHPLPDRPWETIGVDMFTLDGKDYLCTVDYYSDVFEVDNLYQKKDAKTIIKLLKKHFSNHGIPENIFTDNGPPFNSSEFRRFATDCQFEHTTSSPGYPQSNGKVENAVKIAKNLIKKTTVSEGDFYINLLTWRNIPTEGLTSSPAQRLYSTVDAQEHSCQVLNDNYNKRLRKE